MLNVSASPADENDRDQAAEVKALQLQGNRHLVVIDGGHELAAIRAALEGE